MATSPKPNYVRMIDDVSFSYDGIRYFLYFPYEWATSTHPGTGPKQCRSCQVHGIVDDLFIGYCCDCASYMYDHTRGHGFIYGKEKVDIDNKQTSATFTYLKYTKYDHIFAPEQIRKWSHSSTQFSNGLTEPITPRTSSSDSNVSISDLLLRKLSVSSDSTP
jgi:hypothetical protein